MTKDGQSPALRAGESRSGTGAHITCWSEWRQRCALGRCSADTQSQLRRFAFTRFQNFTHRYAHRTGIEDASSLAVRAHEAWHLFESHLVVRSARRGKRYKDWLFARAHHAGGARIDLVQGGATLLMRDVVREHLRHERPPRNTTSLQALTCGDPGDPIGLDDLLQGAPDPTGEAARREYEELARQHGEQLFRAMDERLRIVVLSRKLGISLNARPVATATSRGRTALGRSFRTFVGRLARGLRARYADDDARSVIELTLMTLRDLERRALAWGQTQATCAPLFTYCRAQVRIERTGKGQRARTA